MEFHPIASIFPLMDDESLDSLAADIRQNGLREPIWLFEGKVLDGRNRSTACLLAGVKPETREFAGTRAQALAFVWSENVERRHMDSGKIAVSLAKRIALDADFAAEEAALKQEAKERQKAGKKNLQETIPEGSAHDRQISTVLAKASLKCPNYETGALDLAVRENGAALFAPNIPENVAQATMFDDED